jgi:ABC-2 type transport system permease protein
VISSIKPETLLAGKVIGVGAVGLRAADRLGGSTVYLGSFLAPFLAARAARSAAAGVPAGPSAPGAGAAVAALPSVSFGTVALILVFFLLGYLFYSSLYAAVGSP